MIKKLQKSHIKDKGYTLIELLLVISLLAIAVGVTSDILLNLVRSYNRVQVFNEIEQQTNYIIQKLEKEIRNSVTAEKPEKNVLKLEVGSQDITYRVNAGVLTREVNDPAEGTQTLNLNEKSSIGGVYIECNDDPGCFEVYTNDNPVRVIYDFGFRQSQNAAFASESGAIHIFNYIVLRRSYN